MMFYISSLLSRYIALDQKSQKRTKKGLKKEIAQKRTQKRKKYSKKLNVTYKSAQKRGSDFTLKSAQKK